jgi:hypothetical protein
MHRVTTRYNDGVAFCQVDKRQIWEFNHGKCNFSKVASRPQMSLRLRDHEKRGAGPVMVIVHHEGRKTEAALGGSCQILHPRVVAASARTLAFWSELPGPKSLV